jgi:hypothetical protein
MPFQIYLNSSINDLAGAIGNIPANSVIYFYKDENNNIKAYNAESGNNSNNFGYPFQFINGEQIYTSSPVSYLSIPWNYPGASTLDTLFKSSLVMWLDTKDLRTFNNSTQKMISKGYNQANMFVENTTGNDFTCVEGEMDLTNGANIETADNITVMLNFKLVLVFSLPYGSTLENKILFKFNRFEIRVVTNTHISEDVVKMLCVYDNGFFIRGITINEASDFKYFLYTDNTGEFHLSGNSSLISTVPNYYQATTSKMFVNCDENGTNSGQIKLHEMLLYDNEGVVTRSNLWDYASLRWTLTTYDDVFNNYPPVPTSYYNTYSRGNRSAIISVSGVGLVYGAGHSPTNWINGIVSTSTGRWYPESGVGSGYIEFSLAEARVFDGLKFIRDRVYGAGTAYLNLTASNDAITWVTLKSNFAWNEDEIQLTTVTVPDSDFNCGYLAFVSTSTWSNNTSYTKYRLTFISGSVNIGWENEIMFRSS